MKWPQVSARFALQNGSPASAVTIEENLACVSDCPAATLVTAERELFTNF